jgi:hypothetical protein
MALGIAFVSLGEGVDCTTPAGKLQLHILAALAEFERARIAERVRAGLARVRASGASRTTAAVRIASLLAVPSSSLANDQCAPAKMANPSLRRVSSNQIHPCDCTLYLADTIFRAEA